MQETAEAVLIAKLQAQQLELEKQNNRLREELRITEILFDSQEGMLITDANSIILRANQAFMTLTGYTPEEVIGAQPSIFSTKLHEEEFYEGIRETLRDQDFWQGDILDRRKNGSVYVQRLNISTVKTAAGVLTHYVASFTDITKEKELSDKIHQLAYYDPLTKLPNRRLFQDRLKQALVLESTRVNYGAILFIDLDNFKTLNDTLGHDIGDLLLQEVSVRLLGCMREADTVARLGGDEFVIILQGLSKQLEKAETQAKVVGKKIIKMLNQSYQLGKHHYYSTPSIGITLFNRNQQSIEELLKQADIAMYQAKEAGRNNYCLFSPEMQAEILANINLEADLMHALMEQQFVLYFQVQATHSGLAIGAEALIRWQHPDRGLVMPANFIPLAERTKLIIPIGLWVLQTSCLQLQVWARKPETKHLQLAVNISAHQFHDEAFVQQLSSILEKYAVDPTRLKLELTETLILDRAEDTITKMLELKKIGVSFSIDDFGTGYSSLAYLTQLPFDQLKIDRSFVKNLNVKHTDEIIAQTIIGMAANLGIDVIAEGVETEEQRAFLELHGCPTVQGYLFGKPMPIEQFELALKR